MVKPCRQKNDTRDRYRQYNYKVKNNCKKYRIQYDTVRDNKIKLKK